MNKEIKIRSVKYIGLEEFLQSHNYGMKKANDGIVIINRGELEIFVKPENGLLFFELEIGDITKEKSIELYEDLLDLNTEILPVSIGIDKATTKGSRLMIIESRESENLDENELLCVLQTMEIALAKVEVVLNKHIITS